MDQNFHSFQATDFNILTGKTDSIYNDPVLIKGSGLVLLFYMVYCASLLIGV